jgi:aryl-alcohol dehydrogenase-like predicted oxidoreductase
VITGATSVGQVEENLRVLDLLPRLTAPVRQEIAALVEAV